MSSSVSVVVTFYNNVDYVDAALEQVAAIRDRDFDLLVTDDGSTDGTRELLHARLAGRPRTQILCAESNRGIAAIRNWAVSQAKGDFIWFLDCDDAWSPDALSTMRRIAEESGADVAMVHAKRIASRESSRGKLLDGAPTGVHEGEDAVRLLLTGGVRGYLWNKLIRRDLLLVYPFPPRHAQEDFAVVAHIVLSGARLVCSEEVLYLHIERMGSITNSAIHSYADLEETAVEVIRIVASSPHAEALRKELVFFEQWYLISSVINTSIRLGVIGPSVEEYVRRVRRKISWRHVAYSWRFSRREAVIALAMKALGPVYAVVYRTYLLATALSAGMHR